MTSNQHKANNYLMQIRNASKELTELIFRIDYLRYKASGAGAIRYDKDHVQTSPEDVMCEAMAEAVDLENKLSNRHKQLKAMREHAEKIISLWNNNNAKCIEVYYLNHGSMIDVARQCRCTDRNAYLIKNNALEEFSKYIQHIVD